MLRSSFQLFSLGGLNYFKNHVNSLFCVIITIRHNGYKTHAVHNGGASFILYIKGDKIDTIKINNDSKE